MSNNDKVQKDNKASDAIELAISLLRDIERRAPGTRAFVDYDAFILNELNPALVAARGYERHIQSMQRIVERQEAQQSAMAQKHYANPLKVVTSEWHTERGENQVPCHSRMIDGVLCRWWGDDVPPGVALIDAINSQEKK